MEIPAILDDENAYQYTARNGLENTKLKLSQLSILRWITPQIIDFQNAVNDYDVLNKLNCTLEEAKALLSNDVPGHEDNVVEKPSLIFYDCDDDSAKQPSLEEILALKQSMADSDLLAKLDCTLSEVKALLSQALREGNSNIEANGTSITVDELRDTVARIGTYKNFVSEKDARNAVERIELALTKANLGSNYV